MPDSYLPNILTALGGVMPALPQAPDASQWQGAPPNIMVNPNPAPGTTAAASSAYLPVAPVQVAPQIPMGGFSTNPKYPSASDLTNTLYHETSSQRPTPGGPNLDTLRQAMANAILNARDQNVPRENFAASPDISSGDLGAIIGGLRTGANTPAVQAYYSSLNAALGALNRSSAPTSGPDSGVFFNRRATNSQDPNTNYGPLLPFVGTLGPYYNPGGKNQDPWWAFFGNKAK